jgi:hypothetical protein
LVIALTAFAFFAVSASAQVSGAIYTTTSTGTTVNGNIYVAKSDVYLSGGPQNKNGPGLGPDGIYYFQVTDPSGAVLLSTDDITCRQVVVTGGRVVGVPSGAPPSTCTTGLFHAIGTQNDANGSLPVQLIPYMDTPNPGGEYKAWMTPVGDYGEACLASHVSNGFCDKDSKTDNFKVRTPGVGYVTVCKFNDQNGDGTRETGEPLIPHWPIIATGVDTGSGIGTVNTQTDDFGCVSFSVSGISSGTQQVTLTEGTQGPDWTQTAPANALCTLTGDVNPADTCKVSGGSDSVLPSAGGMITLTVSPDDSVNAPDFGNYNPNCTTTDCGTKVIVTKDANPVVMYAWSIKKSADRTEIDTAPGGNTTFNYTVDVSHDSGTATLMGSIRVANTTGADITNVTVSDAVSDANADGGACTVEAGPFHDGTGTVPHGDHVDVSYSCTFTSVPAAGSNTNTAKATWDTTSAVGTASFDFRAAMIVDGSVTVTDPLQGTTPLGTASYKDTNPKEFQYSYSVPGKPGTCVTQDNTATFTSDTQNSTTTGNSNTVTVKVCQSVDLTVSKTATPSFTRIYKWGITKSVLGSNPLDTSSVTNALNYSVSVTHDSGTDGGWTATGVITVTNPNNWEPITANVTDAVNNGGSCTVTGGTNVTVPASSSVDLNYTCTYASAPTGDGTNTATATWDASVFYTPDGSAKGTAPVTFSTVTPTVKDGSVTVTDTLGGALGTVLYTDLSPKTFTYSKVFTDLAGTCTTHPNTASFKTDTSSTTGSDSKSVQVCVGKDLTVSKTATPSFNSSITKSVDKTKVEQAGGSITFNYTVKVTESGWAVAGNITVTNPNDWEAITTNLADALNVGGASCSITGGSTQTVPKSSSISPAYTCSFSSAPSAVSGINTATASWSPATYFTPDGSASGSANYTFSALTVTDSYKGTLGTVTIPPGSATFTYARTVSNALGGSCHEYDNTATITQTNQTTPNVPVIVCNTATGGLTMGFWQNKNGQAIITGGTSTGGVCNSGTWLKQYAPFQDLSSTATCVQVAAYVYNLIKAANASGASMNAMLKAQMLATSLDVYFSNPALGGNKIGAAQSVGGVKIDLTKVCNMIDSSTGTAACSGSTENTSGAFGGARSLTVSQLLTYAASQSNAGGSIWYAQVKTTQGLAKNTFDAINNQAAYIAP